MRREIGWTQTLTLGDREAVQIEELISVRSDNVPLVIQIFAHGGAQGIRSVEGGPLIPWINLIEAVSAVRTHHPVRLDLLGVCESKFIVPHLTLGHRIDSIWITTEVTWWQSVQNRSRHFFQFADFLRDLVDEEDEAVLRFIDTYREVKWRSTLP